MPIFFSWKVGGFEREMLRDESLTAPTKFEDENHQLVEVGGVNGKPGTRRRFPQVSADLTVRWCSAYLKIDVAARAITNQERFNGKRTLFITGERAEESPGRARYATFERHRTDKRDSPKLRRHVDHWRPVHHLSETEVWALLERWRINPHPAYKLGWGRVSCAGCVFGSNHQWASLRAIDPERFNQIAAYEREFGCTIRRNGTVVEAADAGTPYESLNQRDTAAALAHSFDEPIMLPPGQHWTLPAGAFGDSAGPT
jgi:3'-phosphoadenosine 5'-phosphosulfate sulfotransferase (PAPS reductase)/FAD synthetase